MLKKLIKELLKEELMAPTAPTAVENHPYIGKVCVFRTYSAGVHVGTLHSKIDRECIVKDSRRIWYWKGACTLSQLAMEGSKNIDECKITMSVREICLTEVIEIIPMSDAAITNIMRAKAWKK